MPTTKYLCIISIQKVQSYLFDAIQSHEQEKQTDAKTLRKIKSASKAIAEDFVTAVKKEFINNKKVYIKNQSYDILPSGSGNVMFIEEIEKTNNYDWELEFDTRLVEFYNKQYIENSAAMRISYAKLPLKEGNHYILENEKIVLTDEINKSIKEVKRLLKTSYVNNHAIMSSKDILFSFNKAEKSEHALTRKDYDTNKRDEEQIIAKQLEELRSETKSEFSKKENPNRFYIAYIKADLCGMGEAFTSVTTLDGYIKMSELLSNRINISNIENKFTDRNIKFYPIYAAGDDIFIAVRVTDIPNAVNGLIALLKDVNEELRNQKVEKKAENKVLPVQLSMRIGIDITWSNQPIRYYYQRAEKQMEMCRTKEFQELNNSGYTQICIGDMVFWNVDKDSIVDEEYKKALYYSNEFIDKKKELREKYPKYKKAEKYVYNKKLKEIKEKVVEQGKTYEYFRKKSDKFLDSINPLWHDYILDIQLINSLCGGTLHKNKDAESDGYRAVTVSYLHNLLSVLESESEKDNSVNVLYRLMPPKIQSANASNASNLSNALKYELIDEAIVWHAIAKHFIEIKREINAEELKIKTTKTAKKLSQDLYEEITSYIKLLLLSCDPRISFDVETVRDGVLEYKAERVLNDLQDYYTRILGKLYTTGKNKYGDIFYMFIKKASLNLQKGKTYNEYITLSAIEKSMLFRFKTFMEKDEKKDAVIKIAKLIKNKNEKELAAKANAEANEVTAEGLTPDEKNRIAKNNNTRNDLNKKFSSTEFLKKENKNGKHLFDTEFIDILIVFYSYLEIRKKYKAILSKTNKKTGKKTRDGGIIDDYIKFKNNNKN